VCVCSLFFAEISLISHNISFFSARYKIIAKETSSSSSSSSSSAGDDKKRCTDLLLKYDKTKKEWQLGKTKVRFSGLQTSESYYELLSTTTTCNNGYSSSIVLQVFMKEYLEHRLEKDRDDVRSKAAMIIRAHLLTFSAK